MVEMAGAALLWVVRWMPHLAGNPRGDVLLDTPSPEPMLEDHDHVHLSKPTVAPDRINEILDFGLVLIDRATRRPEPHGVNLVDDLANDLDDLHADDSIVTSGGTMEIEIKTGKSRQTHRRPTVVGYTWEGDKEMEVLSCGHTRQTEVPYSLEDDVDELLLEQPARRSCIQCPVKKGW
jgi:hypothetical protein